MGAFLLTGAHGEPNTPRVPLHLFRREDIRGAAHGAAEKAAVSATLARVPEGLCRDTRVEDRTPAFQGPSKGFTAVSSPGTGKYCLSVAAGVPTNLPVQVTPDWGASAGNSLLAFHDHGLSFCSAGQIEVLTYDTSGNLSANVAFNVLVP